MRRRLTERPAVRLSFDDLEQVALRLLETLAPYDVYWAEELLPEESGGLEAARGGGHVEPGEVERPLSGQAAHQLQVFEDRHVWIAAGGLEGPRECVDHYRKLRGFVPAPIRA